MQLSGRQPVPTVAASIRAIDCNPENKATLPTSQSHQTEQPQIQYLLLNPLYHYLHPAIFAVLNKYYHKFIAQHKSARWSYKEGNHYQQVQHPVWKLLLSEAYEKQQTWTKKDDKYYSGLH